MPRGVWPGLKGAPMEAGSGLEWTKAREREKGAVTTSKGSRRPQAGAGSGPEVRSPKLWPLIDGHPMWLLAQPAGGSQRPAGGPWRAVTWTSWLK